MKVVCVKDEESFLRPSTNKALVKGKVYDIVNKNNNHLFIKGFNKDSLVCIEFTDGISVDLYKINCFMSLDEYRKEQINKLL